MFSQIFFKLFIGIMTHDELLKYLKHYSKIAIGRANGYLKPMGLTIGINWDYGDWDENQIGVYEAGSVFGDRISIGFSVDALCEVFNEEVKRNYWSDPYTLLNETVQTNVFHEMGHGIIELIADYLQYSDELDKIYDANQQLFDTVLDNEEESVEEFAWDFYDNDLSNNDLNKIVLLYIGHINASSSLKESKNGGMNYADSGDEFYTQSQNIAKELSNYDFNGLVVYCNCDNPSMSEFYGFFKDNFKELGLKGLYASYIGESSKLYYFNGSNEVSKSIKSGDFRDNVETMKLCDIVVTNPPFSKSLASKLVLLAKKLGKDVLIVGPLTMAYKKEMFDMIKNNRLNAGYSSINRYQTKDGKKSASSSWWTTLPTDKKPFFKSGIRYSPEKYQKYDDFDAIDCSPYTRIPDDYYGYMGVSPRFLRILNRKQFKVITTMRPTLNGKKLFQRLIIQRLPENEMLESVSKRVYKVLNEKYSRLNEAQGVVENNYDKFAEYLWERCQNNKIKPNKRGEVNFTIPSSQWNKYNTYKISADTISVCIEHRNDAWAAFSYNRGKPTISINWDLLNKEKGEFIAKIMHELTHSVNTMANLPQNGHGVWHRVKPKLRRHGASFDTLPGIIEYLFTRTEMNARLTEAYYSLMANKDFYRSQSQILDRKDKDFFAQSLFRQIDPITRFSVMEKYVKLIDNEDYGKYQNAGDKIMHGYDEKSSAVAFLRFNNSNTNNEADFPQFFQNRMKIKHFMQEECVKFKRRIYKMIYKFMEDINIDKNFGEYQNW